MPLQVKKVTKKRGRRGFGGRWRAYVRAECLGRAGKPSFAEVAREYWRAVRGDGDRLAQLEMVGEAATRAGRACPPRHGDSAFGAKGRETKRRGVQQLRESLSKAIRGMDKEDGALVVAQQLSFLGADIPICLSVARSALRRRSLHERDRLEQQQSELLEFQNGVGQASLQRLQAELPGLPTQALTPVPFPSCMCFECAPAAAAAVAEAVSWAYGHKEANTSAGLRRCWDQLHHTLMENALARQDGAAASKPSECFNAGRCLCTSEGKRLRRLRNAVLQAMKKTFPPNSEKRSQLLAGEIIMQLTGTTKVDDSDALLDMDDPVKKLIFHVGMLSLKPYQPTLMLLENTRSTASGSSHQIRLQAQCVHSSSHGACM